MCNGECKEEKITISLKEYKELLIIKGKYEELKEQSRIDYVPVDCDIKAVKFLKAEITD